MMRQAWEDIVEDFLEVACRMSTDQREVALEALRKQGLSLDHLEVHPAFSLEGRLMVVLRGIDVRHCSLYFVDKGKIEMMPLENPLYR